MVVAPVTPNQPPALLHYPKTHTLAFFSFSGMSFQSWPAILPISPKEALRNGGQGKTNGVRINKSGISVQHRWTSQGVSFECMLGIVPEAIQAACSARALTQGYQS